MLQNSGFGHNDTHSCTGSLAKGPGCKQKVLCSSSYGVSYLTVETQHAYALFYQTSPKSYFRFPFNNLLALQFLSGEN